MPDIVRGWELLKLPIPSTQSMDMLASCVPFYWVVIAVILTVIATVVCTLLIIKYLF
jgi:hypothetical protein